MMGTEAYLICDETREAYHLGKFLGTWLAVDWTRTDATTFVERVKEQLRSEWSAREAETARIIWWFCEHNHWRVRVVEADFFFDEACLDSILSHQDATMPLYHNAGSRYDL